MHACAMRCWVLFSHDTYIQSKYRCNRSCHASAQSPEWARLRQSGSFLQVLLQVRATQQWRDSEPAVADISTDGLVRVDGHEEIVFGEHHCLSNGEAARAAGLLLAPLPSASLLLFCPISERVMAWQSRWRSGR
jgi:hypothetical protein